VGNNDISNPKLQNSHEDFDLEARFICKFGSVYNLPDILVLYRIHDSQDTFGLEINYACSLGSLCHSSKILKRNKYKLCSYPFDWIFSNCDNIIECIEDNFNIFLDKSYYINLSELQCGHSKYHKWMFYHHNPLINTDHYNYFVRCVDRFKTLLQKPEHKLFIMIITNMNEIDENIKQGLDKDDYVWLGWNWRRYRIGEKVSRFNKN
jgi:hypothetical protein